ncbi:MAG: type I-C CRISPR-associated protein Cas5c [Armatimonadota bacterium]
MRVWGDYACFTRPEMKVERVSYPVMTPSAARGVLEAIFWRPEFTWRVAEIWVLKRVQYFSILRNEMYHRESERSARGWQRSGGLGGYDATSTKSPENRVQRHTLGLRDVAYVIRADIAVRPGVGEDPAKFRDQFRRRVRDGRCFATPYLGCREFSASFAEPSGADRPIDWTEDLGTMLLDIDYATDGSGRGKPRFFEARVEAGVLRMPKIGGA